MTDPQAPLGILLLDTRFPRIPGDVGHPDTFPFPVLPLMVEGADPPRVVTRGDPALLEPFLAGARTLEVRGAAAITTSCGFLAMFQRELSAAVSIPVFTSALMQLPLVERTLPPGRTVGILTADSRTLGQRHFRGAGISRVPQAVRGMEGTHFHHVFVDNTPELDVSLARREMTEAACHLTEEHPQVGAILLECTNMPPYAAAISTATGLPVYDITTLATWVMAGCRRRDPLPPAH